MEKVRVRYAPSPTGDPHIGNIRLAVFDWLFARHHGGTFITRLEDTDQNRLVEGSSLGLLQAMQWLGMEADEGLYIDGQGNIAERGEYGPYTQSQRLSIYQSHVQELLDAGKAYRCFATPEELEAMRTAQAAAHQPPRYDRRFRDLPRSESDAKAQAGERFVIRQKMPLTGEVLVSDIVRGTVKFQASELEDHVLLKSDGFPTYQLANVVDDHLMQISHVFRGEEWLPSYPKNILLYQDFGWDPPLFAHMPLILGPDKSKLSKRHGAEPILAYKAHGYLPDGILNMIALLGWNPGTEEELMTRPRLIEQFEVSRVQKSPAVFDLSRLDYVSGWHVRQLTVEAVAQQMLPYLEEAGLWPKEGYDQVYLHSIASLLRDRIKHFDETVAVSQFFFKRPEAGEGLNTLVVPNKATIEGVRAVIEAVLSVLEPLNDWTRVGLEAALQPVIEENGGNRGAVLWPIRAALTGESASPGAYEMLEVLGKAESLIRLQAIL